MLGKLLVLHLPFSAAFNPSHFAKPHFLVHNKALASAKDWIQKHTTNDHRLLKQGPDSDEQNLANTCKIFTEVNVPASFNDEASDASDPMVDMSSGLIEFLTEIQAVEKGWTPPNAAISGNSRAYCSLSAAELKQMSSNDEAAPECKLAAEYQDYLCNGLCSQACLDNEALDSSSNDEAQQPSEDFSSVFITSVCEDQCFPTIAHKLSVLVKKTQGVSCADSSPDSSGNDNAAADSSGNDGASGDGDVSVAVPRSP